MKFRPTAMLAIALASVAFLASPSLNQHNVEAQAAMSAQSVEAPAVYSGIAMPASTSTANVAIRAFDGRITIAEIHVENGATVKKGDLLATLKLNDYEARLKAAEEALENAKRNAAKAEVELAHERQVREYNIAKAELDLKEAEQDVKNFKEFGKADRLTQGEQRVEGVKNSIKDQEDELKQLRKLYGKNELATESQDIVLSRSERRLKDTKENLVIEEHRFKVLKESGIPAEEWKLPHEVNKHRRALQKARLDQHENVEKKEKAHAAADKAIKDAEKKLEGIRGEAEKLEVKAGADGTLIFGALAGNNGFDGGISKGAQVKSQQVLFSVVDMNSMVAEITVPVAQRKALLASPEGKADGASASITGIGLVAHGDRLNAKIKIDANGEIMIGQRITFTP